jgi:hypothetical protein
MAKFIVPMWWYELHNYEFVIEANDKRDAYEKAVRKFQNGDFSPGETFSDYGQHGVDEIEEVKE